MSGQPTPDGWQELFLEQLIRCGTVTTSAYRAGVSTQTAYREREKDDAFRQAWDEALTRSVDDLAANMLERAKFGVDDLILHKGEVVKDEEGRPLVRRRFDSTLQIFMLKKRRPGSYGDHIDDEDAGEPVELPPIEKPADVRKALDVLREAYNRGQITGKRMERLKATLEDELKVMVAVEQDERISRLEEGEGGSLSVD